MNLIAEAQVDSISAFREKCGLYELIWVKTTGLYAPFILNQIHLI